VRCKGVFPGRREGKKVNEDMQHNPKNTMNHEDMQHNPKNTMNHEDMQHNMLSIGNHEPLSEIWVLL
jgi:hypothetical protein